MSLDRMCIGQAVSVSDALMGALSLAGQRREVNQQEMTRLLVQKAFNLGRVYQVLEEERVTLLKENALLKHQFEDLKVILTGVWTATQENIKTTVQEICSIVKSLEEKLERSLKEFESNPFVSVSQNERYQRGLEGWHRRSAMVDVIRKNLLWIRDLSNGMADSSLMPFQEPCEYFLDLVEKLRFKELLTDFPGNTTIIENNVAATPCSSSEEEEQIDPLEPPQREARKLEAEIVFLRENNHTLQERINEFSSLHAKLITLFKTREAGALLLKANMAVVRLQAIESYGIRVYSEGVLCYLKVIKEVGITADNGFCYIETYPNSVERTVPEETKTWLRWRALEFFQHCEEVHSQMDAILEKIQALR